MSGGLVISGITKSFGDNRVLDGIDLVVPTGAMVAALGPSGGGKTTLLRIIAGFLDADAGSISFNDRALVTDGRGIAPQHRGIGYVPQEGALFPHLNVAENIAFGVKGAKRRHFDVASMLALVDLPASLATRYPHKLSGGQQQRVALARALAPDPDVVLLDEPFSSLDAGLRFDTGRAVMAALRTAGATAVLVTHDQGEALALADEVAVMRSGQVAQVASPTDLYRLPSDPSVAAFVGSVVSLEAVVVETTATCALGEVTVAPGGPQGSCRLLVRPEHLSLGPPDAEGTKSRVVDASYFGHDAAVQLELLDGGIRIEARVPGHDMPAIGDLVTVRVDGPIAVFAGEFDALPSKG